MDHFFLLLALALLIYLILFVLIMCLCLHSLLRISFQYANLLPITFVLLNLTLLAVL